MKHSRVTLVIGPHAFIADDKLDNRYYHSSTPSMPMGLIIWDSQQPTAILAAIGIVARVDRDTIVRQEYILAGGIVANQEREQGEQELRGARGTQLRRLGAYLPGSANDAGGGQDFIG